MVDQIYRFCLFNCKRFAQSAGPGILQLDGEFTAMLEPMYLDGYIDTTRPGICMESLLS